jgi:hypothetical protein
VWRSDDPAPNDLAEPRCLAVFLSHQQTIGTSPVQLELPSAAPGTDYRAGFSVLIKHNGAAVILIGGPGNGNQHWDLEPDTPFPLNDLDPGELPYLKAAASDVIVTSLWQGL